MSTSLHVTVPPYYIFLGVFADQIFFISLQQIHWEKKKKSKVPQLLFHYCLGTSTYAVMSLSPDYLRFKNMQILNPGHPNYRRLAGVQERNSITLNRLKPNQEKTLFRSLVILSIRPEFKTQAAHIKASKQPSWKMKNTHFMLFQGLLQDLLLAVDIILRQAFHGYPGELYRDSVQGWYAPDLPDAL